MAKAAGVYDDLLSQPFWNTDVNVEMEQPILVGHVLLCWEWKTFVLPRLMSDAQK